MPASTSTSSQESRTSYGTNVRGVQNPYCDPSTQLANRDESDVESTCYNPLLHTVAHIALRDLFAPCEHRVPSPEGARQLLETFNQVIGRPFSCPRNHPLSFGRLGSYANYCSCCIGRLDSVDYVWWCKCSNVCVACGAEGALRVINGPTNYQMPPSVFAQMPMR